MKFFVHDFSTWTYCSFSSKRNLHWKYLFEKGKTKTFLSRHILSLAPKVILLFGQRKLILEMELTIKDERSPILHRASNEVIEDALKEDTKMAGSGLLGFRSNFFTLADFCCNCLKISFGSWQEPVDHDLHRALQHHHLTNGANSNTISLIP